MLVPGANTNLTNKAFTCAGVNLLLGPGRVPEGPELITGGISVNSKVLRNRFYWALYLFLITFMIETTSIILFYRVF